MPRLSVGLFCVTLAAGKLAQADRLQVQGPREPALFRIEWALSSGLMAMQGEQAGHAFILSMFEGAPLLAVTAHHVMQVTPETRWDEVASLVRSARLRNITDGAITVPLGPVRPISGARRISGPGSQDDVAAFAVPQAATTQILRLAERAPGIGDTVWVFAATLDGNPATRHPARVTDSGDLGFRYAYLGRMNANWTSGAAVLDRSGRVVGVNVGTVGGGDNVVGLGVGWAALRTHLLPLVSSTPPGNSWR
jgi:hypothetical protein